MVVIIDNYDSFTFNLYQMIGSINKNILVIKNDEMTLEEFESLNPSHIVISPGPGRPDETGIAKKIIKKYKGLVPILGICLGHQAIGEVFGAKVSYAKNILHGKSINVHIANGNPLFKGLPPIVCGGRYNSLMVERESLPDELLIIAETEQDEIMGIKHKDYDIYGLQFHPESILTKGGEHIINNFLKLGGDK